MKKILEEDGIEILLNANTIKASGAVELQVELSEGSRTVKGSHLLLAAGRVPNTEALNLEAVGIATDERGLSAVRRFGMGLVQRTPPLKRWFMDEARGVSGAVPELLKG